jgi:hypothetical protein
MRVLLVIVFLLFVISVPALLFARTRRWAKWTVVIGFFGVVLIGQFVEPRPTNRAGKAQPASQAQASQSQPTPTKADQRSDIDFHCLSSWDGSLRELVSEVKENLREPDSFEHIDTRVTKVDADGNQEIIMRYRARNGFGGMSVSAVRGSFRNSDCALIEWHSQE